MNLIKKILANPYLKSLVPTNIWALAALLIAIALFALLIYLIIKRRRNASAPAPDEQKPDKQDGDFLSPASLRKVWKTFLKNIPAQFRRSIMMYQPYIVIGEAGTGKTTLIDTYTDWKNQANQFYPSHTQDPLLQIYLGSRAIVQEIPAALLHDTSPPTRTALKNLWKCFKRKKGLTVVITLKAEALINGDPDSLKEQAQMIRGKINVLSEILKRPVGVKIALTFMNHINGFPEFSEFMKNNNMPFELQVGNQFDLEELDPFIKQYEKYLSNALISETSGQYLKILSFFKNAPLLLSGLSRFIHIFREPDPLSPSPIINSIFFTAPSTKGDKPLSNPFKATVSIKKVRSYHPLKRHRIAAAALVLAGISYLLFSYYYKQNQTRQILANLDRINTTMIRTDQERGGRHDQAAALLNDFEIQSEKDLNDRWLIDFFPDARKAINARKVKTRKDLLEKIVQKVLNPELTPVNAQRSTENKNLLLLALIYASNSNELGRRVNDHMDLWVTTCRIPQNIIESYISLSDDSRDRQIPLKGLVDRNPSGSTNRYRSWLLFLRNIEKFQTRSFISPRTLSRLQKDALTHIEELDESLESNWFDDLRRILARETILGDRIMPVIQVKTGTSYVEKEYAGFKQFLDFFWQLKLDSPEVEEINLEQLLENLRVMMALKHPETQHFNFEINKQAFYFNSGELHDLMTKSSMVMLLRKYVSYYSRNPGTSFFHPGPSFSGSGPSFSSSGSEYDDLVVDISSDNNFYFSKKAVIDGRYTREIYDKQVMPVLKALPDLLEKLPVSKADKTHFSNFMFREVEAYIQSYITNYKNYYKGFRIDAGSVGELRYILTQMTLPLGQFQEFLMVLNDNLSLEYGDNPYFGVIKSKLRPLGFIPLLMQEQKDQFPELEKYKAILRQVLDDLISGEPENANETDDDLAHLKAMLSPEARIGLDIFLDGPESYLNMIQKWGTSVGIPEQWLYPFTAPVQQISLLGQKKIETAINRKWKYLERSYITPVMDKFPFNPEAESPVTPEALKDLTGATGEFWKSFSRVIAPLCRKGTDGKWRERSLAVSTLKFPKDMFKEVNYISQLSQRFFNEKGEPRPLIFDVKPHPLPLAEKKLLVVVLSYIRAGKNTVFGFNQQPSWHPFSIEWWKPETASVGVEFMEKKDRKMFANISAEHSYWSFYRLLARADAPEYQTWMWEIESPGDIQWKRAISFSIRKNPWSVFQRPSIEEVK
jgi:hypothetical protein